MSFWRGAFVLLFIFSVLIIFKGPGDPDFGWHYKYGEYMVEHRALLRANTFSYTFPDYEWANSYWVSELLLYLTHRYLGSFLAGLLFTLVFVAAVFLFIFALAQKVAASRVVVLFLLLLAFLNFSAYLIPVRPLVFSTIFLMLLTLLFIKVPLTFDRVDKKLFLLIPLFLVWANVHADFVLGLFIVLIYYFAGLLGEFSAARKNYLKTFVILTVPLAAWLVTLVNPYGATLWLTLLKESNPFQFSHIAEWVPVNPGNLTYFALYCVVIALATFSLVGVRNKLTLWYVLVLGFFIILSFRSQYFLRLVLVLGIMPTLLYWSGIAGLFTNFFTQTVLAKMRKGLIIVLVFAVLAGGFVFVGQVLQCTDQAFWVKRQGYPKAAIDYMLSEYMLSKNKTPGNVFNWYGWGGYMIWQYPNIKTFVDGRMPSWREGGKSVFEDYVTVLDSPKNHLAILSRYNVTWVLLPPDSGLSEYLRTNNVGWKELYKDDIASIFVIIKE